VAADVALIDEKNSHFGIGHAIVPSQSRGWALDKVSKPFPTPMNGGVTPSLTEALPARAGLPNNFGDMPVCPSPHHPGNQPCITLKGPPIIPAALYMQ
jgi:hypothetical protein